jgi:hypothetical protein
MAPVVERMRARPARVVPIRRRVLPMSANESYLSLRDRRGTGNDGLSNRRQWRRGGAPHDDQWSRVRIGVTRAKSTRQHAFRRGYLDRGREEYAGRGSPRRPHLVMGAGHSRW